MHTLHIVERCQKNSLTFGAVHESFLAAAALDPEHTVRKKWRTFAEKEEEKNLKSQISKFFLSVGKQRKLK
jgi:hypothetical protein